MISVVISVINSICLQQHGPPWAAAVLWLTGPRCSALAGWAALQCCGWLGHAAVLWLAGPCCSAVAGPRCSGAWGCSAVADWAALQWGVRLQCCGWLLVAARSLLQWVFHQYGDGPAEEWVGFTG